MKNILAVKYIYRYRDINTVTMSKLTCSKLRQMSF